MASSLLCCLAELEAAAWAWELVASRRIRLDRFEVSDTGYTLMHQGETYTWQGIPVHINSQRLFDPLPPLLVGGALQWPFACSAIRWV